MYANPPPRNPLPLNAFRATEKFVIHSPEFGMVSQHQTSAEAVAAFAKFLAHTRATGGAIYKRRAGSWHVH